MKRRGVYEAGLPASSRRIATTPLIPLAFQLQRCNLGEDSCRTQHIQAEPEQFGAIEHFATRCGSATADPREADGWSRDRLQPTPLVIWEIASSVATFTFRIL